MIENIQMVDLNAQYLRLKPEIDSAILDVLNSSRFIKGPVVHQFENSLAEYQNCSHVIGCANGTDALQIALMALDIERGDEVIVPSFTYVATAEVIALLGFKPVMVDVDMDTFNTTADYIRPHLTEKTKAIVPVHLYGQSSNMDDIMSLAQENNLYVIEDNAQAIGAAYTSDDGQILKTGTIGHIGTTSFFPSKNLGCYGDGGAIFTNENRLAEKIKMIANHGQKKKYYHEVIGVNSRLDAIQAAVLKVKLKQLDDFAFRRQKVAAGYDEAFESVDLIEIPFRSKKSTHVFHQYTIKVKDNKRDALKEYLSKQGIPSMIYYPVPLYKQNAFSKYYLGHPLANTELLCEQVLSLPIHTEMSEGTQAFIIEKVVEFCNG